MLNEQQLEDLCIGWFQETGWQFAHGPDFAKADGEGKTNDLVNRAIETAQAIEELIQMAKEFQAVLEREAALGLSPDEIAFYDALSNNESAMRELGDEALKAIAREVTEKLRASTTVDWQVRESVRARLRILVRRCLQKWKYPPDQQADAVELVLKQAEPLSNEWSK